MNTWHGRDSPLKFGELLLGQPRAKPDCSGTV